MISSIFIGALFNRSNEILTNLKQSVTKQSQQFIISSIFKNLKNILENRAKTVCPGITIKDEFYNFSLPNPYTQVFNITKSSCFLNSFTLFQRSKINSGTLTIEKLPSGGDDLSLGQTSIRAELKLSIKDTTTELNLNLQDTRLLRIRVSEFSEFALVILDTSAPTFIEIADNSKLDVFGETFLNISDYPSQKSFELNNLLGSNPLNKLVTFMDSFFTIGDSTIIAQNFLSLKDFQIVFRKGINYNYLANAQMPTLSNTIWNQKIDYGNNALGTNYPLLENMNSYDSSRGELTRFPDNINFPQLNVTCGGQNQDKLLNGAIKPLVLYKLGEVIFLKSKPSDLFFCGYIIADTLDIEVPINETFLMIGSFWTKKLIIHGGGGVVIYNPMSSEETPINTNTLSTISSSLSSVIQQLLIARVTLAYNFFMPLLEQGSTPPLPWSILKNNSPNTVSPYEPIFVESDPDYPGKYRWKNKIDDNRSSFLKNEYNKIILSVREN